MNSLPDRGYIVNFSGHVFNEMIREYDIAFKTNKDCHRKQEKCVERSKANCKDGLQMQSLK